MDVMFSFVATCIPAPGSSEPRIVAALSGNNSMQLGRDVAHNNAQTFDRVARCLYKEVTLFHALHMQIQKESITLLYEWEFYCSGIMLN
jgi:hypothetical protein